MSRCFPFPPPGYEKKVGHDDVNLLEKDKKEKKRKDKKDKKEKDKRKKKEKKDREGKQNKDKEKSEDKHRKKKDQNEKHKDKNDKRAKKEKNRTSDEKYIAGPVGCSNGETPGSNCSQSEGTSEFKFLVEFGKRIKDEDKATENPMVQKINLTGKRSADFPGEVLKDKRDDDRKVFGQSNKVDARGNENGSVPNFIGGNERKVEGVAGLVDKYVEKRMEQKENDKHKNNDSKGDRNKDRDREKKSKSKDKKWEKKKPKEEEAPIKEQPNARESNLNAVFYSNNKPSSLLKKTNKNSHLGKRKELEMNGNLLDDSDIRPSKLQRPLHAHEVVENGRKLETRTTSTHSYMTSTQSLSELVGTVNNHKVNRTASFSRPVAENGPKLGVTPGKIQFGKHSKVNNNVPSSHPVLENGRILAMFTSGTQFAASECTSNDHKVDNKVSLFHPVLENGKVELYQAATGLATEGHAPVGNQKVNGKEIKINGLIEDKKPVVCSTRPSVSPVKVEKNVGKSLRPPHPDSKYLSQIFSIPSIKCSDFDDQEWLLGSYDFQTNKVRSGSSQVETKQVWAEALRIESADVTALPYVIPY